MDMRKLLEAVAKFAGEPEQKPGDQWKGTDSAPPGKKLVGDSIIKDLAKGPTPKTKEQELAEAYAKFLEDNLGVEEKRPSRKGSRPARDMGKTGEPSKRYNKVSETEQGISKDSETKFHKKLDALVHDTFGKREEEMKEGWGRGNDRVTLPDDSTLYWSGNGPLQQEYDALYNELVPSQGKADTIEGEVLRAASKIVYRHYNDGDEFNQASFEQLVPYIGAVTSYDDLAHKSTEFAIKANGNYTPNPNWDSLDVMEYGPEQDDYDDEEDDDDWDDEYEDPNEEDDEMSEAAYDPTLGYSGNKWNYNPSKTERQKEKRVPLRTFQELCDMLGINRHEMANIAKKVADFPKPIPGIGGKKTYYDPQKFIQWAKRNDIKKYLSKQSTSTDAEVAEGRTTWNSDWYVYNPETLAVKKKFRTYKGAKQYAEANGLKLAASEWYHDKINTQKQTDEGWESGPEERSGSRERDPDDAYDDMRQQKADDAAQAAQARRPQEHYYTLTGRGPNMEPNYAFPGEYSSQDEAVAARARLMADPSTPNPRMIGISKRTRYLDLKEGIESTDPVEGAVLAAVQELIQQGHTEVAPEVITNMVVAATSQPFLLKDLVDCNNNSAAVQHYIDSINPTKVKFSNKILTVKNEDPLKDKKSAQAGVSSMAARAAGRNRLGEASTPLRDREDYDAKNKALQDIQMDPSTSQDPQLSAELARRKAELVKQAQELGISESRAHKLIANKLKQIELQRQLGSPESDAAYAQHVDSLKKSKEEYLKKTPNTIYKREVEEAGSAVGGGATNSGATSNVGSVNPETVKQTTSALNTFKSATGSNAPAPNIAKALDAVTQGTAVGGAEMKILEPVMKDLATVATDPKLASQFKSLAGQVNQTQNKQQQQK